MVDNSVTPKQQKASTKLLKSAISNSVANQNQSLASMLDYLVSTPDACGVMADTPTQSHASSALASKSIKMRTTTWQKLETKQLKRGPSTPLKTPRRTGKVEGQHKRRPFGATPGTTNTLNKDTPSNEIVLAMPISSFETPARSVAADMARVEKDAALWGVLDFGDGAQNYLNNKEEDKENEDDNTYPGTPASVVQLRCELAKTLQGQPLTRLRHGGYETDDESIYYGTDCESESEMDESFISTTSTSNDPSIQTITSTNTNSKTRPCISQSTSTTTTTDTTPDYLTLDSLSLQQKPALNPFLALKRLTLQKEYDAWLYQKEIEEWQERLEFVELEKKFLVYN